jgi:hypothetical protein
MGGFDGLVLQVQEQNRQLKEALESETRKPVVGSMAVSHEMLDFKKMFAETKAHAKVSSTICLFSPSFPSYSYI